MSWFERIFKGPRVGKPQVHIGDPRFDDWDVVRDFEDVTTARSWCQHLRQFGIAAELTSDWPLDHFGRGDIALRVRPEQWSEAEELLSGLTEIE